MRFHPTRGLDEPVAEGRRPAARLGGAGRRHDPRRLRAAGRARTTTRRRRDAARRRSRPARRSRSRPALMTATAELAERLDVRLHTHLAEDPDEDDLLPRALRLPPSRVVRRRRLGHRPRAWVAHCVYPNDRRRSRGWVRLGCGVAHCPSSNMILGTGGRARSRDMRAAGTPVGLGLRRVGVERFGVAVDGGAQRAAAREGPRRGGRDAGAGRARHRDPRWRGLPGPRRGRSASCPWAPVGDLVVWASDGVGFAGALTDPIEAWLRCGPGRARETVVAGRVLVKDGALTLTDVADLLARHRVAATRLQAAVAV